MGFKFKRAGTGIDYAVEFLTVAFILLIVSLIFFSCSKQRESRIVSGQIDRERLMVAKTSFIDYFNEPVNYANVDMDIMDFLSYSLALTKDDDLFDEATSSYFEEIFTEFYVVKAMPPALNAPVSSKLWNIYVGEKGADYEIKYLSLGCKQEIPMTIPLAFDGNYKTKKVVMQVMTQGC